jgi:hypothetical protein
MLSLSFHAGILAQTAAQVGIAGQPLQSRARAVTSHGGTIKAVRPFSNIVGCPSRPEAIIASPAAL